MHSDTEWKPDHDSDEYASSGRERILTYYMQHRPFGMDFLLQSLTPVHWRALGVSHVMHYINLRYLLTYLLASA